MRKDFRRKAGICWAPRRAQAGSALTTKPTRGSLGPLFGRSQHTLFASRFPHTNQRCPGSVPGHRPSRRHLPAVHQPRRSMPRGPSSPAAALCLRRGRRVRVGTAEALACTTTGLETLHGRRHEQVASGRRRGPYRASGPGAVVTRLGCCRVALKERGATAAPRPALRRVRASAHRPSGQSARTRSIGPARPELSRRARARTRRQARAPATDTPTRCSRSPAPR